MVAACHFGFHLQSHDGCQQISRREPVQYAVTGAEFRPIKQQEIPLGDRSQAEHDDGPPGSVEQQSPVRLAPCPPFRHPQRDGRPHDEHKKRPDQIVEMQALPGHVLELFEELIEERPLDDLAQAQQNCRAASNPEHIEPA